jgi:hypothetical protein
VAQNSKTGQRKAYLLALKAIASIESTIQQYQETLSEPLPLHLMSLQSLPLVWTISKTTLQFISTIPLWISSYKPLNLMKILDMDDFQPFIDDQDDSDDDLFNPKLLIPGQNITPRSHQEHRRNPLLTLSKPQNKPATIPTAASSRPSRTTKAKTPKLQAKGSLERNYHLAHVPFKNSTQAFISQRIHIFAAALTRDPAEPLTSQGSQYPFLKLDSKEFDREFDRDFILRK